MVASQGGQTSCLSGTHKNGDDDNLDVMCILPQGKINVYIHA